MNKTNRRGFLATTLGFAALYGHHRLTRKPKILDFPSSLDGKTEPADLPNSLTEAVDSATPATVDKHVINDCTVMYPGETGHEVHIILGYHAPTFGGDVPEETALSKLQEYHLLRKLIAENGVGSVFTEGPPFPQKLLDNYKKQELDVVRRNYANLVENVGEDQAILLTEMSGIPIGYILLAQQVNIMGWEDKESHKKALETFKKTYGNENERPAAKEKGKFDFDVDFMRSLGLLHLANWVSKNDKHPASFSIGGGHRSSLEYLIASRGIPGDPDYDFRNSPTFYLHDTEECRNLVSMDPASLGRIRDVINAARKK